MSLTINATSALRYERTVDSTGKLLTEEQRKAQAKTSFVGHVHIEMHTEAYPLMRFRVAVINGRSERVVLWPNTDGGPTGSIQAFELGDILKEEVERLALHVIRMAIQADTKKAEGKVVL